jgi:exosortase A-associated hydrolase 1
MSERAVTFPCKGSELIGIVHEPETPAETGLLILTGGDQYRVGAHRQYLLLARRLAAQGFAVMRFDDRANGDAEGERYEIELHHFEDTHDDLWAAAEEFQRQVPTLKRIVLWGLCGAVSSFLLSPKLPPEVGGLVLINPWVRTEAGSAKTYLKHYYIRRLLAPDLWKKLLTGRFALGESVRSIFSLISAARAPKTEAEPTGQAGDNDLPLPDRMANGFERFTGPVLFILSGDDYTAQEFKDLISGSTRWKALMGRSGIERRDLKPADHTFSTRAWHRQLEDWTLDFVSAVTAGPAPE